MGFKTDTSFLRFLTMGAVGVRQTIAHLRAHGFEPIELERYCSSNKIWMTKVKRLRLPDLLCVKTGLRVEVRAKSDLKIRMSDAPNNPDRTWDAGLGDEDIVALISVQEYETGMHAADTPVYFTVGSLRASVATSRLGPPKSASEGAERDRTWPSVVPSRGGRVKSVNSEKLVVEFNDSQGPIRSQTYTLNGKTSYVHPDETFLARSSMLAGAPATLANLTTYQNLSYNPLQDLGSTNAVDRYAAAKALRFRAELSSNATAALEAALAGEADDRVALEFAATLAALGSSIGREKIEEFITGDGRADLRMEAVLILTEIADEFARSQLLDVANNTQFSGNEIRQAAVWGLGRSGLKKYSDLIPFIADPDENVAMHAIVAFSGDASSGVIDELIGVLLEGNPHHAAAASRALSQIGGSLVVQRLISTADNGSDWVVATLGQMPPELVKAALGGTSLAARVAPLLLLNSNANWLMNDNRVTDLAFLERQTV